MEETLLQFERTCNKILEISASMSDSDGDDIDVMPRVEVFLISSFLLNIQQAA